MIKTFALASVIYEDDLAERKKLPFKHNLEEDIALLTEEEAQLQRDISLISTFGEFSNLGLELSEEDKIPENALKQHLDEHEEPEELIKFLKSDQGGGGMAKCYPVSYIQGNFAYHAVKKTP